MQLHTSFNSTMRAYGSRDDFSIPSNGLRNLKLKRTFCYRCLVMMALFLHSIMCILYSFRVIFNSQWAQRVAQILPNPLFMKYFFLHLGQGASARIMLYTAKMADQTIITYITCISSLVTNAEQRMTGTVPINSHIEIERLTLMESSSSPIDLDTSSIISTRLLNSDQKI